MAQLNRINSPYLHPCARKQHSGVPAELVMFLYEAEVFVRQLGENVTDGKLARGKPRRVSTYVTF